MSRVRSRSVISSSGGVGEGGRGVEVVLRQVGQQRLDVLDRVVLVGAEVVGVAGLGVVGARAAELLHRHVLAGDGLDDVGAGDEHVGGLVDHDREVGDRGGVDVPAGAGAHDHRDLRDHPRRVHVAPEDLAVEPERDDTLLDAGAGALVDADDRAAGLDGEVHHLGDLLAVDLAQRPAEDGEVLGEHAHLAAVDGAVAGHHAVAVRPVLLQPERHRAVPGQLVELDEGALVEEQRDPLARGLAALGVLLLDRLRRPGVHGLVEPPVEVGQLAGRGVDVDAGVLGGQIRALAGPGCSLCGHVRQSRPRERRPSRAPASRRRETSHRSGASPRRVVRRRGGRRRALDQRPGRGPRPGRSGGGSRRRRRAPDRRPRPPRPHLDDPGPGGAHLLGAAAAPGRGRSPGPGSRCSPASPWRAPCARPARPRPR